MDDGRRHETPRSEIKGFSIHSPQSKHHGCHIYFGHLSPKSMRIMQKGSGVTGQVVGLHHTWGTLSLGTRIFYDRFKKLTFCPGGKSLYHTGQQANLPFALEGITIPIFQEFLLNKHPSKDSPEQKSSSCHPPGLSEMQESLENCLSERDRGWTYEIMQDKGWDLLVY